MIVIKYMKILYLILLIAYTNAFAQVTLEPNRHTTPEKFLLMLDDSATPQTINGIALYGNLDYFPTRRISSAIVYAIDNNGIQNKVTSFEPPAGTGFSTRPAPKKAWGWEPLRYVTRCEVSNTGWTCPIVGHTIEFVQIKSLNDVSFVDETLALINSQLPVEEQNQFPEYTNSLLKALAKADGGEVVINQIGNFRATESNWTFQDRKTIINPAMILVCHQGRNTQIKEIRFIKHIEHGDTVGVCPIHNRPTRAIGVNCNRDWVNKIETCELSNKMPGLDLIKAYGTIYTIEIKHWETPFNHCYQSGCYITQFGLSLNGGEWLYMRYDHEDDEIWLNSGTGSGGAKFWAVNSSLPLQDGIYRYDETPTLFSTTAKLQDETATPNTIIYDEYGEVVTL